MITSNATNNKIPDLDRLLTERNKEFGYIRYSYPTNKALGDDKVLDNEKLAIDKLGNNTVELGERQANSNQISIPVLSGLTDPNNDMDKYIKPSDYLKVNILPPMDQIYFIDYNLSLDIRSDLINSENYIPEYCFQFTKFGNISKVELTSLIISKHSALLAEPYLFVNIREIDGRCHLSNGKRTFGKIMLMEKKDQNLIYVPEDCLQIFSSPICLNRLTVSICNYQGIPINLKEIKVNRILKSKTEDDIIIIESCYPHNLEEKEKIEVQMLHGITDSYTDVEVKSIISDRRFSVNKSRFDNITNTIRIFKNNINFSVTFKLSEINWFILNDNSVQSCQLIKLSQMIKEKNQSITV